ncbi:MAG: hypothetical protein CMJ21_03535 [Phycisphaerae bacterium]|nr:hypothetical protein [Phycisphaerae bacterium]
MPSSDLHVHDLGRMAYEPALRVQRRTHANVLAGRKPPTLLLVEHEPVITVSSRNGARAHVLADDAMLKQLGIDVQPTDRGGDVTYHGPGQLVAYPIVPLNLFALNVGRYLRMLELVVIETIAPLGVSGFARDCGAGVWVKTGVGCRVSGIEAVARELAADSGTNGDPTFTKRHVSPATDQPHLEPRTPNPETRETKLASIGVRIEHGVSLHGVALNVTTDLLHFETIMPCGMSDCRVTSLRKLLADDRMPAMCDVKEAFAACLRQHLAARAGAICCER